MDVATGVAAKARPKLGRGRCGRSFTMTTMQTTGGARMGEVFDVALLAAMLAEGYVRVQVHPELPLTIYNYTEQAAYEGVWNEVTLACRGLVVDLGTDEVLARPFRKFFNHGQPGCPVLDLAAPAVVSDKVDGSLGVLYPVPSGHAVATRGSFDSEQARHATGVWRQRYADRFTPPAGWTMLFEIVYPGNRIVCDYGDLDDLVLLGAVQVSTGRSVPAAEALGFGWPGPVAETFAYASLAEALTAAPRPNAEGLVVHLLDADERVKLKQEDYIALHRIITGLNARTVWEYLITGAPLGELVAPLPDEFHPWVQAVAGDIAAAVDAEAGRLAEVYTTVCAQMPAGWLPGDRAGRRDYAMVAARHPDKWALFNLLDGKDIRGELLRRAKPGPNVTPTGRVHTEDTA
jgi:RNA ligase